MNQFGRHACRAPRDQTLGTNVARLLSGAWREAIYSHEIVNTHEPADDLFETELNEVTPLLCRSGAGALAWHKIRNTPLGTTAAGEQLHEVYRRFRLSALIHEREIAYVFSLLRAEGIEAVLVKGWAIAHRYPHSALRPYGDIDLCVAPDQFAKAQRALRCLENIEGHYVDLHCGLDRVGRVQSPRAKVKSQKTENDWDQLFARSQVVECGDEPVRILSDEDHLRILSLHLLRSGAWRPLWLCDVALLLESVQHPMSNVQSPADRIAVTDNSRGLSALRDTPGSDLNDFDPEGVKQCFGPSTEDFNWDVCFGRDPLHAKWVCSTIALAHQLLGADIAHTPFDQKPLPRWLAPAVLKQWGRARTQRPRPVQSPKSKVQSHVSTKRHWTLDVGLWTSLYSRWDNPIRSTAAVGGQFNSWPRLPYRVAESVMRLPELPKHLRLLADCKVKSQNLSNPQITPITQNRGFESV
jgi:hypothetical protein